MESRKRRSGTRWREQLVAGRRKRGNEPFHFFQTLQNFLCYGQRAQRKDEANILIFDTPAVFLLSLFRLLHGISQP